jgi:hypothetical protein
MGRNAIAGMFALALSLLASSLVTAGQSPAKVARIGYLGVSSPSLEPHYVKAFQQQLRELGYVEGQHVVIEYRWAEGRDDRLPALAAELIRSKVDVIVTTGTPGAPGRERLATRPVRTGPISPFKSRPDSSSSSISRALAQSASRSRNKSSRWPTT